MYEYDSNNVLIFFLYIFLIALWIAVEAAEN